MDSLTDVPGIAVGHAEVPGGASGCTVLLGPFRGRVDRRGPATGSRELEAFREEHPVSRVDALHLTGGSAFGLASAQGVVDWLEEAGRGYKTRVGPVPIVPAAVIYDLATGQGRPGPAEGLRACRAASPDPVAQGRVGVGAGATAGKALGLESRYPAGVGSAAIRVGEWVVGALVVVNAVGEVFDEGRVAAGPRAGMSEAELTRQILEQGAAGAGAELAELPAAAENTTLAVVATDGPLEDAELTKMARLASTALARRISPVHTPFDGDLTFALSTTDRGRPLPSRDILLLGLAAREALERAILRSVGVDRGEVGG